MKPPGKVLLVANNFPPIRGGSARVYENIARYAGGRVVVVASRINYIGGLPLIGWREYDRQASFPVHRLNELRTVLQSGPWRGFVGKLRFRASDVAIRVRLVALLLRLIWAEPTDAVCIGELVASGWLIGILRRLSSVRTLVYVHGEEVTTEDEYDPGHDRARQALLRADRIIVVSRFTQGIVRKLLGPESEQKISLLENGVDPARFRPQGKRRDLAEQYQLEDRFVFVSVCRLLQKKGIDYAIQAFATVVRRHPECRYLVVGTGEYEAQLRQIAVDAGLGDSVIFAGDVPEEDLTAHYCLGDVFVMPNRRLPNGDTEGFGLVFLEANSCHIPVIAGQDGGSRDAVQHGVNGLVVDGSSIGEITAAMLKIREDTALRDALRTGAAAVAAAAGWQKKAEIFLRLCSGSDNSAGQNPV